MPEQESSAQPAETRVVATESQPRSETFMATAMQIMNSNQYTPTQAQVDKMLSLQEKGMDYTHKERTTFTPQRVTAIGGFVFFTLVIVGLFVFCVYQAPEYASQILSGAVGVLTGALGGYGYANRKSKRNDE